MINFGIKIGSIIDRISFENLFQMLPTFAQDKIVHYKDTISFYYETTGVKRRYVKHGLTLSLIFSIITEIMSYFYFYCMNIFFSQLNRLYSTILAEKDGLLNIIDKTLRQYPTIYDSLYYVMSMNMNRNTAINMYHKVVVQKIGTLIESLEQEMEIDERFSDYITSEKISVKDDINQIAQLERERLYSLTNFELYKLSDDKVVDELYRQIDDICRDFNRMFYHDKFNRRIVRQANTMVVIKVSEEIKNSVWNVIEPWAQKCCVTQSYMGTINLKDIEKEFMYYPNEEVINYITGDCTPYIVFPRTGLTKIIKVISSAKIRQSIKDH
ncbi:hypothetical protein YASMINEVIRUS_977 [Yasminevirus sp. GU-2018]|uniref:Uncharacterized protein n=1 Tax=Yasminevirus sp. GU-2018 TaxID=2420051 RepID=A0A5K0UAL7_9VIRU|nr:hypothetical protein YASMINEVIRUS_977 [Yasminevirus sp. GU-2018]